MDINTLSFDELIALKQQINHELMTRADGFFYIGLIVCAQSYRREEYNNSYMANKAVDNSGYGDNYLIEVYTNNPNFNDYQGAWLVSAKSEIPERYNS